MTKLDAVNDILQQCGQAPVATIDGVLPPEASTALKCLLNAKRTLCEAPRSFNVVSGEMFYPDTEGRVYLPDNTLSAEFDGTDPLVLVGQEVRRIGSAEPLGIPVTTLRRVIIMPFADLPYSAADLVTWAGAAAAYTPITGSETIPESIRRLNQQALLVFLREERRKTRPNALQNRGATRTVS